MAHEMRLEYRSIDKIKPYEKNPRVITEDDISKAVAVIEAQGFLDPIHIWADDDTIIAGHRRWLSAKRLQLVIAPCIVHYGLSEGDARAFRLSSNRLSEDTKWARPVLADELLNLEQLMSPDLMGFSEADVVKLFDLDGGPPGEAPGALQEVGPPPLLEPGETWHIGPATFAVYRGLDPEGLRKAEALIPKIAKLLKSAALLEGDEARSWKTVMDERRLQQAAQGLAA